MRSWGGVRNAAFLGALCAVWEPLTGCTDPGEADWQKCAELEKADQLDAAAAACNAAYEKSPESELGMKARTKAVVLAAAQASRNDELPPELTDDVDARNAAAAKVRGRLVRLVEEGDKSRIAALEKLVETAEQPARKSYENELELERQIIDSDGPARKKLERKRDRIRTIRVRKADDALEAEEKERAANDTGGAASD